MSGVVQDKIVLVTGGGSGIGRATASKLAQEGARVMIADYIKESGERTVKMIEDAGGAASFIQADVSVAPQIDAMVTKTVGGLWPYRWGVQQRRYRRHRGCWEYGQMQ
jgi:NAD(P)-dependent dehydrogenase (short-subunit alcohol dehydrogenase family)